MWIETCCHRHRLSRKQFYQLSYKFHRPCGMSSTGWMWIETSIENFILSPDLINAVFPIPTQAYLKISLAQQRLFLIENSQVLFECPVSTGKNGAGETYGSGCTPRGWLVIKAKIGEGCPENSVFVGRRATGEIYNSQLQAQFPERDWILSRILWLGGLEPRKNRYGAVDTLRRFIYLHGTPDTVTLGVANSKGCIRLHNAELIHLFEQVKVGTRVFIGE